VASSLSWIAAYWQGNSEDMCGGPVSLLEGYREGLSLMKQRTVDAVSPGRDQRL